jgi:fibronectin type 3 domain-containing protein
MANKFYTLFFFSMSILFLATCTPIKNTIRDFESENGISMEEDSKLSPLYPNKLSASIQENQIILTWVGTGSDVIEYYKIYRKSVNDDKWEYIDRVNSSEDNRGQYYYRERITAQNFAYEYAVTAVDIYGNESEFSRSVTVEKN